MNYSLALFMQISKSRTPRTMLLLTSLPREATRRTGILLEDFVEASIGQVLIDQDQLGSLTASPVEAEPNSCAASDQPLSQTQW